MENNVSIPRTQDNKRGLGILGSPLSINVATISCTQATQGELE